MNTSTIATIALLTAGCGMNLPPQAYPPTTADQQYMNEIEAAWEARGLESLETDRCDERRRYMRMIVADDELFPSLCHRCNPGNCPGYQASEACPWGCASACFRRPCVGSWPACWGTGNEFLGGQEHLLFISHQSISPGGRVPESAILHEYIHVLEECSGRGVDRAHGAVCRLPDGKRCRPPTPQCACRREGPVWGPGSVHESMRR